MGAPFALFALVIGAFIFLAIYLWTRQREDLDVRGRDVWYSDADEGQSALFIVSEQGKLIHVNDKAEDFLGVTRSLPDIEYVASLVSPSENFLNLLSAEGTSSFQFHRRWVEASSHFVPTEQGRRTMVVLKEISSSPSKSMKDLNLSLALSIVNEIGEMVDASMGMESVMQVSLEIISRTFPSVASEICLWDPKQEILHQRGWLGDARYLLSLADWNGQYTLGQGVPGWIAEYREPLIIDTRSMLVDSGLMPDTVEFESAIGIALNLSDTFLGTLIFFSDKSRQYNENDIVFLQAVSKPIAKAIDNARLYSQQEERITDIASLQQIAEKPSSDGDISAVYRLLNERISKLVAADICGILLYDDNRRGLMPQLPFYGLLDNVAETIFITMPPDSPQYDVWQNQGYWLSNDVVGEQQIELLGLKAIVEVAGIENATLFPLSIGSERIGMILICNKRSEGGFTPRDMQNLRILSMQASIVVENLRLYQREQRIDAELVGLQEMTHAIGALSHEQELFAAISERIARLTRTTKCGVLVYEEASNMLFSRLPFHGVPDDAVRDYKIDLAGSDVIRELWEDNVYWYSNRIQSDPLVFVAGLDDLASELEIEKTLFAVMQSGGRRIGVVQISDKIDGSDFDPSDARLLQIFATQASAIIENARLYQEVQRRADQAERLRRVAEMAGAVVTTDETIMPVLAEIANLTDSTMVFINVLEVNNQYLTTYPRYLHGFSLPTKITVDANGPGMEHSVVFSGKPFFSNNVLGDERVLPGYRKLAMRFKIDSCVIVPLMVGERKLGELGIANRPDKNYTDDDVQALEQVSAQLAVAFDRLVLYEATGENLRRRMEELDAISRVSNELALTVDLDAVLDVIRHEAMQTTAAVGSTVVLLQRNALWPNPDQPRIDRRIGSVEVIQGLCAIEYQAIRQGFESILVADYKLESELEPSPAHARSAIAAPILYLDEIIGVVHVYHDQANSFDDRAASFLMTLATKASLGYQNSMRYHDQLQRGDRLRQRVDQLNRIFELTQMIHSQASAEEVLTAIAYSVQQSVGFDVALVTLLDPINQSLRRTTHAGMPLSEFTSNQHLTINTEELEILFKEEFRISESYFFPIERVTDWYTPNVNALSAAYDDNRTVEARGDDAWHDGDMLIVPITGPTGNLIGTVTLDRPYDNRRPDRTTIEVLEIFAHQASSMIENSRLFSQSRQSAEQEVQINQIMKTISSTLDISEIAETMASGLRSVIDFNRLTLAILESNQQGFQIVRVRVTDAREITVSQDQSPSLYGTALGRAFENSEDLLYQTGDAEIESYNDLSAWYRRGEKTSLIQPIFTGGETIGVMHIGSDHHDVGFFLEARNMLQRVTQLVAGAIQNARLFNQAINLQMLNLSVVESIQQGIIVLDQNRTVINVNEFMREQYHWTSEALRTDLFIYAPSLQKILDKPLQQVIETGEPLEITRQIFEHSDGIRTINNFYLYPLRSDDSVRGVVLLLEDLTDRAQLERTIEDRANQLESLTDVSTRITASLERDDIIDIAIKEMRNLIPYSVMSIWRRNGTYMVKEGDSLGPESAGIARFRISEHPSVEKVIDTRRVVPINYERGHKGYGLPGESQALSWMGIPLVTQGHVVGLIIMTSSQPNYYTTREEHHVAFAFASQVAVALANADLFEQTFERTTEMGTLLEAAQTTSLTRELSEVYRVVAELMFSALEMSYCSILIWDKVDDELEVELSLSRTGDTDLIIPKMTRYVVTDSPAKRKALESREVVLVYMTPESPYQGELDEMHAINSQARMLVPLVVRDQAIGLIQLDQSHIKEGSVSLQRVRLAQALGTQVAVAIENAQLTEETTARFEELLTINALSQAISSTLDLNDVMKILREQVPSVTGAEEMYLALYNEETDEITYPLSVKNKNPIVIPPRPLGTDEVSYVIRYKRPLVLASDYFTIDEQRHSMHIINGEGDIRSYMGVPVVAGDKILGVLAIRDRTRKRAFNLNDERILKTVASQLGATIQNARLFAQISNFAADLNSLVEQRTNELEEERDRLDTLYQITSELARTLDMDQLLERALGMVSRAVSAQDGIIFLSDPALESLDARAAYRPETMEFLLEHANEHPAQELALWLLSNDISNDHILIVDNLHDKEYWDLSLHDAEKWNSALAVSLESNEGPMGVMVLLHDQVAAFSEAQISLLVAASNQVATAINSADLYELIRDQAERLGLLLRTEKEEAQKQTAILEGIADGVMLADTSGEIIMFNSAAERILRIPRDQVIGQPIERIAGIYGTAAVRWTTMIEEWARKSDNLDIAHEFVSERVDLGDRVISAHLSPVFIRDQYLGNVSVFRDITRDVEVDRIKSEFIENVSHEFRTPLTPIKGYTDLLLTVAADNLDPSQLQMLHKIKDNVDRLTVLVNDVLNIAKLDTRKEGMAIQPVDLRQILPGVLGQIESRPINIDKSLTTSVMVNDDVPHIQVDREKFIQALANIIDNAFNYTRSGGDISIHAHKEGNRSVIIEIKDSGVGIPDEYHEVVWRRFERYQAHALELDVAGTGLGLPLVKEVVNLHHGEVWFESELGVGTTFFIRMPIEQPSYQTSTSEILQIESSED